MVAGEFLETGAFLRDGRLVPYGGRYIRYVSASIDGF